jgi:hypothetical protein
MDRADKLENGFVNFDLEKYLSMFTIYRYGTSEKQVTYDHTRETE